MTDYIPLSKEELHAIKPGDIIERMLGFSIPCYLKVHEVTEDLIMAGWEFHRDTGLERDDDISSTASYIRRILTEKQKQQLHTINLDSPGEEKSLPYP